MKTEKQQVIAVIGGDTRSAHLANMLADEGYTVIVSALEKQNITSLACFAGEIGESIGAADIVVLPMPASRDGITLTAPLSYGAVYLSDIFAVCGKNQLILGGMITPPVGRDLNIIDFAKREDLSILNAVPTAEAAIEIAIRETDISIFGSECLVVGFGRIGKLLAALLKAFHANVTVSARKKSDIAWIKSGGYNAVGTNDLPKSVSNADIIFNTVPSPVLGRKEIVKCKKSAVIIDLASLPGGTDFAAAEQNGVRALSALSLPGKTAPRTAAAILCDIIKTITDETKERIG